MRDTDRKQFAQIVRSTMMVCGGEAPDADVIRIWWASLEKFDLSDVSAAFSQYAQRGKYAPKPADILEIIDRIRPDGRPGADEAWAMIPRDESASVVWTQEMSEALGVAQPLLDECDQIAARMAFKESYQRIVERNKLAGVAPVWIPSLGTDPHGRDAVLTKAVTLGRLSCEHAAALLPQRNDVGIAAALIGNATLRLASVNGNAVEDAQTLTNVNEKLSGLRAAIGSKSC
jgi:hypothetical protein